MKQSNVRGQQNPIPGAILLGACLAVLWAVVCSAVIAKWVHVEKMALSNVGWAAMTIHLTAGMIAGFTAWGKAKKSRVVVSLGAGGGYYLTLLGITALLFGGIYTGMGVAAVTVLLGCGVSILPALAGQGRRQRGRYKIRRS